MPLKTQNSLAERAPMQLKTQNSKLKTRTGFTLIELLVVISIILLLVGLLAAGVSRAIIKGQEARNRNDIMQLEMALQAFKTQYGFYPPSRLQLYATQLRYTNDTSMLSNDSQYYLGTMFPRMFPQSVPIWDWIGGITDPNWSTTIFGDQCLVFFLGGIKDANGVINGFSTNPKDPTQRPRPPLPDPRTPTFYEFQLGRLNFFLDDSPPNAQPTPNSFPTYLDVYGKRPYAYFSAYKTANGYAGTTTPWRYGNASDCMFQLSSGPYRQVKDGPFWKPNSFQIISAGRDKQFGNKDSPRNPPGGVYYQVYSSGDISLNAAGIPPDGQDDQANFAAGVLGGGQ